MPKAFSIISKLKLNGLYSKYDIDEDSIGAGSYGCVFAARDKLNGCKVAIKIIKEFPEDTVDRKRLYREIRVLHMLKGLSNTIHLKDMVHSKSNGKILGLALVFDSYQADLHTIIQSKNKLSELKIQHILYQILAGINFIHSANLSHRDLKPANILINADCKIGICDFGLSRATKKTLLRAELSALSSSTVPPAPPKLFRRLTYYVVTRWYRSPELILGNSDGGEAPQDLWSVGCILAELLLRKPLFESTSDNNELINLIFYTLGKPGPEGNWDWINCEELRTNIKEIKRLPSRLNILFPNLSPQIFDLLTSLLQLNPADRITAAEALRHPFFDEYPLRPNGAPLEFSLETMSEQEQRDINDYYALEVDTQNCGQSEEINLRLQACIEHELDHYSPPGVSRLYSSIGNDKNTVFGRLASSSAAAKLQTDSLSASNESTCEQPAKKATLEGKQACI